MKENPVIFDIVRNSYVDGPGIRTTVFFKGCNLKCAWCHNPESQSPSPQLLVYGSKCIGCGKCREKCPRGMEKCTLCGTCALFCPGDARELCGERMDLQKIFQQILRDKPYYDASGGGVTFSGGECMLQIDSLEALLKLCKEAGIHTAVDTAGLVPFGYFERIIPYADLFLYDIKTIEEEKHRQYTGAENRQILENFKALLERNCSLWVRIPVIPGVNDTEAEMAQIKALWAKRPAPRKVELLPYHAMGSHKYEALGKEAQRFSVPEETHVDNLRKIFA